MNEKLITPKENLNKNKTSKKLITICATSFIVIVAFLLTLILFFNRTVKYPDDFLGVYDTITNQRLSIGDSRSKIESILGVPDKITTDVNTNSTRVFYNHIYATYDSNNKVDEISVSYRDFMSDEVERFTYSDFLGSESILTEFIDRYGKYAYNYTPDEYSQYISIFLKPTKNGYELLDKKTLSSLFENEYVIDDIYVVSVDYSDYTCIWGIDIKKGLLFFDPDTLIPIKK